MYSTLEALLEAFQDGAEPEKFWEDATTFGGPPPPDTQGVWSWDDRRLLVGTCGDDAEIVTRLDHALTQLMDDPQARGSEHWWAEVWRAVGRGEHPADDWSRAVDGIDAMLAARADDADAEGWTGRYPAALRGLALAAGAVSDKGKPSGQAIHAAVGAAEGGVSERTVRYWLSGQQPMPWSAWAALRGMLPTARPR